MKTAFKIRLFLLMITFLGIAACGSAQSFTNDPKTVSTIPTDTKTHEIKIKNKSDFPEIFIVYKYNDGDHYWEKVGSVSVFSLTEAKFFVDKTGHYGFNVEGKRPIRIENQNEKWKVKYRRGDHEYR